ncbi:glycosyltransferase, partial [Brachyspira pulli]
MEKNFIHYIVWFIPIRSLRDKFRSLLMRDNLITRNFCYWVDYISYSKNIKNKKTFFVTNDWIIDEKYFKDNFIYIAIKNNYINDLEICYKADIELFSPIGKRYFLEKSKAKIKIFYTGECVSNKSISPNWAEYSDNCINDVDLSLGFDRIDENKHQNYVRFPIWIS